MKSNDSIKKLLITFSFLLILLNFSYCNKIGIESNISELKVAYFMQPIVHYLEPNKFKINYKYLNQLTNEFIQFDITKQKSTPLFFCPVELFDQKYYIILDNQNQLWLNKKNVFNDVSQREQIITNTNWNSQKNKLVSYIKESSSVSVNNIYPSNLIDPIKKRYNTSFLLLLNYLNLEYDDLGKNNTVVNQFNIIDKSTSSCYFISITFTEISYPNFIYRKKTEVSTPFLKISCYKIDY